ncbi:hypothetical protein D3C76_1527590 [compost metagenome]
MQYEKIMSAWNLEEAAHRYLAYKFGSSIPINFKPLIEHVLRSVFAERSEAEFTRDAHTMYAVRPIR